MKAAGGGEFGGGIEDTGADHGDDEIALAAGTGIENGGELELAQGTEDGGYMAVRTGTFDDEGVGPRSAGRGRGRAGERGAQSGDE